jgi:parallel beta-helix repeat protein
MRPTADVRSTIRLVVARLIIPAILGAQSVAFTPGMTITHSVRVRPGRYDAPAGDSAALVVRGSGITVDLTGVELVGDSDRIAPDRFTGTAILVDGGRNVVIKGVRARGYKVGIFARHVTRLSLLDNDLSYNWRPRLYSGIEKESLIDWLDYHNNEHDEWLRYGAGIYLDDITIGEIKGNTVTHGMDGMMVVRSTGIRIWNNTFSYNSGVGLGLYRASHNYIMHNRIDWNVRGYADGFYNRGQDSGGLLIYEQSSNNVVAYNSVTHSGDGLFLWAGQSTMDTGQGGCNDNLFYANDFSYAPTNGIEATFSRNAFVANRVDGNWHGLWGGYSYGSVVLGNHFDNNGEAIAIEHGQNNEITGNTFTGDTTGIHLWWNQVEPSDWGYPKHRDTHSRDYTIGDNRFAGEHVAIRIDNTQQLHAAANFFRAVDTLVRASGDTTAWRFAAAAQPRPLPVIPARFRVSRLPGAIDAITPPAQRRGRSAIIVDEWGPYDWKSPKLWPVGRDDGPTVTLKALGPPGRWRVVSRDGIASLSADSGTMAQTIVVTPVPGREGDFDLELEYHGAAVVTPLGEPIAAGKAARFGWRRFAPAARWHLDFIPFDSTRTSHDDSAAVSQAFGRAPVASLDTNRLDLTWYAPPLKAIRQSNVLTRATASINLAPGRYLLRTIADDAVRVYVDDRLVLDDWTPGESHLKEVPFVATGTHRFRVEHLQLDGWYELRLDIDRMPQ